jgi:putative membrane protein
VTGFTDWSASWPALGCYMVLTVGYVAGLARLPDHARPRARAAVAFQSGLLLALLTLVSPAGYWADRFLWLRALQFILLAVVATGLMVLGAPGPALRQAVRPRARGTGAPPAGPVPGPDRAGRRPWLVRYPVAAVAVVNVVWLGWQLPVLATAARTNSAVAAGYHGTVVAAGLLFWLQLAGPRSVAPPLRRLALVVATVGVTTIGGMVLVFGSAVLYPGYANQWHHVMTVLDDQQLAGAVYWMGMLPPLIVAAVALLTRWLSEEESAELSAGLDRLLIPRKNAWSARPGMR